MPVLKHGDRLWIPKESSQPFNEILLFLKYSQQTSKLPFKHAKYKGVIPSLFGLLTNLSGSELLLVNLLNFINIPKISLTKPGWVSFKKLPDLIYIIFGAVLDQDKEFLPGFYMLKKFDFIILCLSMKIDIGFL